MLEPFKFPTNEILIRLFKRTEEQADLFDTLAVTDFGREKKKDKITGKIVPEQGISVWRKAELAKNPQGIPPELMAITIWWQAMSPKYRSINHIGVAVTDSDTLAKLGFNFYVQTGNEAHASVFCPPCDMQSIKSYCLPKTQEICHLCGRQDGSEIFRQELSMRYFEVPKQWTARLYDADSLQLKARAPAP